jgi:hydrogenase maturation protein HypF
MRTHPQVRHRLVVRGVVQGVGFRPFVHRLATGLGLGGFVRNDANGVVIELEGNASEVKSFPNRLIADAPALSRIEGIAVVEEHPVGEHMFRIETSGSPGEGQAAIPADVATCEACLRELFEPGDRRYRYPFINCTDCGPRYSIARAVPWDRERTAMDAFPLCEACRREYDDPVSRRFHAEPNACPDCGPRLELRRAKGFSRYGDDALQGALDVLARGGIVAVKGVGGFLLAVDARNETAVSVLRARKRRPHKPFALLARDVAAVEELARVENRAREVLVSAARPIVLLPARPHTDLAPSVAPGVSELGFMLPCSPLHHLLVSGEVPVLVMTSGNVSDEPIARENQEALSRLDRIADAFLLHDRQIHARVDDSVIRMHGGRAQLVRRGRGYAPQAISLPFEAPPVLAVGAELKNTVCLTRGAQAVLSPHIGDLQNEETWGFFEASVQHLQRLMATTPMAVAHDLHPDYRSTRWARACGLPAVPVQHHHAHVAACMIEHGRTGPVLGVAFDGTGCGPAGDLWGGEILLADLSGYRRLAHLQPLPLPGGEAAIREPWRLAGAALIEAGVPLDLLERIGEPRLSKLRELTARPGLCPRATGAGRWFDAVAALCGVRDEVTYEAQAAIELESLAVTGQVAPLPFKLAGEVIDLRPTVRSLATALDEDVPTSILAARFHETLAAAVLAACRRARDEHHVSVVALSGGCFQNQKLAERTRALLEGSDFEVLVHQDVPPNDGGVALGQAAIAAYRIQQQREDAHVPRNSR